MVALQRAESEAWTLLLWDWCWNSRLRSTVVEERFTLIRCIICPNTIRWGLTWGSPWPRASISSLPTILQRLNRYWFKACSYRSTNSSICFLACSQKVIETISTHKQTKFVISFAELHTLPQIKLALIITKTGWLLKTKVFSDSSYNIIIHLLTE